MVIFIGDFGLGNSILLERDVPAAILVDGHTGITPGAMGDDQDRSMLERGPAGVREWHTEFGTRARYVLWSVFGRQISDRLAGRYTGQGRDRHPVFNYDDIAMSLSDMDIVDLSPLLRLPMHEVSRLFIDASIHPSQVGYLLLNGLVFEGLGALEAYDRAVATVDSELHRLAQGIVSTAGRSVVLTGRSAWLDTFSRYMGAEGTRQLAEVGLLLAPLDATPGRPTLRQITSAVDLRECAVVIVSAGGKDLSGELASAFHTGIATWAGATVVDWEGAAVQAIQERGETPNFSRLDSRRSDHPQAVRPDVVSSMVEQGPLGMPSWSGIVGLLEQLADGRWIDPRDDDFAAADETHVESSVALPRSRASYDAAPFLSVKHSTYFPVYDHLFSKYVGKSPVIVEVGVLNGGSLFMWREFFGPAARIIGVDLNPEATWLREDGFDIHIGDQTDPEFWADFFADVGDVDIFLDDGGHTYPQQIVTASSAMDHIRDGGVLVVEDTHTSYMADFGGPSDTSFISWAVNLVHGINRRFSAFASDHRSERRVWSIEFFESIVAFHVNRSRATAESVPTRNGGAGRDAKDFRYRSDHVITDDELRHYFSY
ncbi:class I SAM-dependent methyltransferase [Microbacterium sp. F2E]|uniref:class I SAM-dependent methyltransferase n=1 Tax=Microbacterium sp. F2E TaxID=2895284 RepID=UPI001E2A8823|nr:class I SAM-dependent methyltransferase [Microbacterium sp. F2E]MCC9055310.1 class I SAM-dependent methyltransferase [Microbacterium sp. F2E]